MPTTLNSANTSSSSTSDCDVRERLLGRVGVVLGDELDLVLRAADVDAALLVVEVVEVRLLARRIVGERGVGTRLRQARAELDRVAGDLDRRRVGDAVRGVDLEAAATSPPSSPSAVSRVAAAVAAGAVVIVVAAVAAGGEHEREDGRRARAAGTASLVGVAWMVPFRQDASGVGGRLSSAGEPPHEPRRAPPTIPSGRTYIKMIRRDTEDRRREQLRAVRVGEEVAQRCPGSSIQSRKNTTMNAAEHRPEHRRRAADHDRDEELDRELERLDLAGVRGARRPAPRAMPAVPA